MSRLFRLAPSTFVEPLVHDWSAWSYPVAPVTACLHAHGYQLPLLRSYLADPALHFSANQDVSLIGGSFVNIAPVRADEVGRLLGRMETDMAAALALAPQLLECQRWLARTAQGQTIEPLYARVPEALRGRVELVYDYLNRPSLRVIERPFYRGEYSTEPFQSFRLSTLAADDARTYFLNTPRLLERGQIDWRIPFRSSAADALFRLDLEPQPEETIQELLSLEPGEEAHLRALLVEDGGRRPADVESDDVRVRYFGHACILVEHRGISMMTDPCVAVRPTGGGLERYSFDDLPTRIDVALITHNHADHVSLETLLRLRHRIGCVVVPRSFGMLYGDVSLKLLLTELGFRHVVALDDYERLDIDGASITGVPFFGEHADLSHGKTGYVIEAGGRRIYAGADSDCLDERVYTEIRRCVGPVDTVFLGLECVGAPLTFVYGCLLDRRPTPEQDQTRRQHGCDAARAATVLRALGATRFYNYAMGLEPWMDFILGFGSPQPTPQFLESERMLRMTGDMGLAAAERLYGRREIRLPDDPAELDRSRAVAVGAIAAATKADAEDQFAF
jgi:L-ascorbate metabolism protein UlaG (beta-lactamase superfamily)